MVEIDDFCSFIEVINNEWVTGLHQLLFISIVQFDIEKCKPFLNRCKVIKLRFYKKEELSKHVFFINPTGLET